MNDRGIWNADVSILQRRVNGLCLPGEAIRSISGDGTVNCVSMPTGDIEGITTAGNSGLAGGCTQGTCSLSVDPSDFNGTDPIDVRWWSSVVRVPRGTWGGITSVTVAPGSAFRGQVLLTAHSVASCYTCLERENLECGMGFTTTPNGVPFLPKARAWVGHTLGGLGSTTLSLVEQHSLGAGASQTYYLRGNHIGGVNKDCRFDDTHISAVFIPNN